MKRAFLVVLALLLAAFPLRVGAEEERIYIGSAEELSALSARVAGGDALSGVTVCLTTDIRLDAPFTPIGKDTETPFSGTFLGCGKTVIGLRVEGADYAGLFGCVYCGTVEDVKLEDVSVSGGSYAGAVAGRVYSYRGVSAVNGCTASGTVRGEGYTGGIVGYAGAAAFGIYAKASISNCAFEGDVNGDINVGGILGKGEARSTSSRAELHVSGCETRGSVLADGKFGSLAGGICGALHSESNGGSAVTDVTGCFSFANAEAALEGCGGICGAIGAEGYGASSAAADCAAFGSAAAAALAGGICGQSDALDRGTSEISGCIAAGSVFGGDAYPVSSGTEIKNCSRPESPDYPLPDGVERPVYASGDVNGDGAVNNVDAVDVLMYDAGTALLGAAALSAADLNGSGTVNNVDAVAILCIDAGIS